MDNQEYEQVPSAGLCQVLLEGLRPGQSHTLAVQALCGGGQASPRAQLLFQGVVSAGSHNRNQSPAEDKSAEHREEREHGTDLSSVLDKLHYRRGHKRKVKCKIFLKTYSHEVMVCISVLYRLILFHEVTGSTNSIFCLSLDLIKNFLFFFSKYII